MSHPRCEELVDVWLATGDASAAAELDRLLHADASARAAYYERMMYEAGIRGALKDEATERKISRPISFRHRRPRPRPRRRAIAGYTVAAVAASLAAVIAFAIARHGEIVATPDRAVAPADTIATRVDAGGDVAIRAGETMTTGSQAWHLVLSDGGTRIDLTPDTTMRIDRDLRGERVHVERGGITAEVTPRTSARPFSVETPNGTATVVGTAFTVDVGAASRFAVVHGEVAVAAAGATSRLSPGDAALCVAGEAPRVARRVAQPLAELADAGAWAYRDDSVTIATLADGLIGARSLRLTCAPSARGEGWAAAVFPRPRDLSAHAGLSLVITGPGVDRHARILLELVTGTDASPPDGTRPYSERYLADIAGLTSGFAGWREIHVPFTYFEGGGGGGGVHLDRASLATVRGLMIVMSAGVTVGVERIGAYDEAGPHSDDRP